ncbi:MAG: peptidogalycan biosysnthesis protein, partial [Pseudomonadota bacterium]
MDGDAVVEIRVVSEIDEISAQDWDACAAPETSDGGRPLYPFTTHGFLSALEASGSASVRHGWGPQHLIATVGGEIAGVMPLYIKGHSQGEYVFDHSWAHAFERAGGRYYPKLQAAVPFTPATGPRLLVRPDGPIGPDAARSALLQGAIQLAERNELSSLHITFCTDDEWTWGGEVGLLQRTDQQFHWLNHGYDTWDDFLQALASRKRKNLRKERDRAIENGIEILHLTGSDIQPEHWEAFWIFYQDTGARKWGTPYLTRAFFDLAQDHLRDDILL